MIPTKVSLSCNNNPYYLDFWEPVSRMWRHKMNIHPYLFFVGDEKDAPPNHHGTVVVVKPSSSIPIHTQAQWARFHFVQTDLMSVWLTSDIDMFPLSKMYFVEMVSSIADDCFVNLNTDMKDYFPVCYNMATGETFRKILELDCSFEKDVAKVYHSTQSDSHSINGQTFENWSADERYSSKKICEYRSKYPHKVIQLNRPDGFHDGRRINRTDWSYDRELVEKNWYLDSHSIRPYRENVEEIENLLSISLGVTE